MDPSCLFCRIVQKQVPAQVLSESGDWISFKDVHPQAPVHFLIIPKRHLSALPDAGPEDRELVGAMLLELTRLAREHGAAESGFRIVNNCNRDGGQTVPHLHFHLLAGRPMSWPPG